MARKHGKTTKVTLNAVDISEFCNKVDWKESGDTHETTGYKANDTDRAKTRIGGLTDGSATLAGYYDTDADGPNLVIPPLIGDTVTMVYQPEGVGTGKPTKTVSVVVKSYDESSPVGDVITWQSEVEFTDEIANTTQA